MKTIESDNGKSAYAIHEKRSMDHDTKKSPLRKIMPERIHGEIIGKIACSFYCIPAGAKIDDIAGELLGKEEIKVVGVLNKNGEAMGIIAKEELMGTLSKPFGRELFINKTTESVMRKVPVFNFNRNILSVSEEISGDLDIERKHYYLLADENSVFAGVFCSNDLLIYLSEMTQRDISLAKRLQSFIVKEEEEIHTGRSAILASSKMARGVGGDYYSIKNYADGKYLLALCDVSGKGMSASLLSVLLDGMLNIYDLKKGIEGYIKSINAYILTTFKLEKFVTGIFMDFDEKTGAAVIFDMGHSYSYLFRQNKFIQLKMKHIGLPVGIDGDCEPRGNSLRLNRGDLIMLFSDGIEEQKNPKGEEFGLSRLVTVIKESRGDPLPEIKNRLLESISSFRGNQTQLDDITMVFLHYR